MSSNLDAELKAWAGWVHAQRDKSVGWPGHSPITRFGQPSGKGFGTDYRIWDTASEDSMRLDGHIRALRAMSVRVLVVYYVQCHARVTVAARLLHRHPTQLRRDLAVILLELQRSISAAQENQQPVASRRAV